MKEIASLPNYWKKINTKKVLLVCGILSTILYVVATILSALQWMD